MDEVGGFVGKAGFSGSWWFLCFRDVFPMPKEGAFGTLVKKNLGRGESSV